MRELKFDNVGDQFAILNGIKAGTQQNTRIGNKIRMKNLKVMGQLFMRIDTPTATVEPYRCRVALVYDRQPSASATQPAYINIFARHDEDGTISAATNAWDPPNRLNSDRFIILRDCKFSFPTNNSTRYANDPMLQVVNTSFADDQGQCNFFIKLRGLEANFVSSQSAGTPITWANFSTGSLFLVCFGNAPTADATLGYRFISRLNFWDN